MPDLADVLNLLGFVQGQNRDLQASVSTLKRAERSSSPDMSEARYNLGVALWYSGDRTAALESLQQAVRLNPALAEAYAFEGMALKNEQVYRERSH